MLFDRVRRWNHALLVLGNTAREAAFDWENISCHRTFLARPNPPCSMAPEHGGSQDFIIPQDGRLLGTSVDLCQEYSPVFPLGTSAKFFKWGESGDYIRRKSDLKVVFAVNYVSIIRWVAVRADVASSCG